MAPLTGIVAATAQTSPPATDTSTAVAALTSGELLAVTLVCGVGLLITVAFLAYVIYGQRSLQAISDTGVFTIAGQISLAIVVIYVITIMMFKGVVEADAGLPILAGLAGVIVGKARGGAALAEGNGKPVSGGGGHNAPDEEFERQARAPRTSSYD